MGGSLWHAAVLLHFGSGQRGVRREDFRDSRWLLPRLLRLLFALGFFRLQRFSFRFHHRQVAHFYFWRRRRRGCRFGRFWFFHFWGEGSRLQRFGLRFFVVRCALYVLLRAIDFRHIHFLWLRIGRDGIVCGIIL